MRGPKRNPRESTAAITSTLGWIAFAVSIRTSVNNWNIGGFCNTENTSLEMVNGTVIYKLSYEVMIVVGSCGHYPPFAVVLDHLGPVREAVGVLGAARPPRKRSQRSGLDVAGGVARAVT
ncbi:hypothetical protein NQ315_007046 [Exocentrus adspersus]|uniref:Uncharacterized protein n=1 Tax=Exocentrus adspersus TaxID=1586481 RepID=A0AAV8WCK3_9CUCU|nr:hypothetical protein NQ315_007046 [Exocentrus adspersus]